MRDDVYRAHIQIGHEVAVNRAKQLPTLQSLVDYCRLQFHGIPQLDDFVINHRNDKWVMLKVTFEFPEDALPGSLEAAQYSVDVYVYNVVLPAEMTSEQCRVSAYSFIPVPAFSHYNYVCSDHTRLFHVLYATVYPLIMSLDGHHWHNMAFDSLRRNHPTLEDDEGGTEHEEDDDNTLMASLSTWNVFWTPLVGIPRQTTWDVTVPPISTQ